jgi:hypothetical protein
VLLLVLEDPLGLMEQTVFFPLLFQLGVVVGPVRDLDPQVQLVDLVGVGVT